MLQYTAETDRCNAVVTAYRPLPTVVDNRGLTSIRLFCIICMFFFENLPLERTASATFGRMDAEGKIIKLYDYEKTI